MCIHDVYMYMYVHVYVYAQLLDLLLLPSILHTGLALLQLCCSSVSLSTNMLTNMGMRC